MPAGKGEIFLGPIVNREENKREIRAERSFPGGSMVKKPQELQVQSLGQKDALEKETATHSSVLAGESHGQRSLAGYGPWGCKELVTT